MIVEIQQLGRQCHPIDVNITEAYLMPINSGSTVYNLKVDFSTKVEHIYYDIKIKTYKTYNEWEPFKYYTKGEKGILLPTIV